MMEKQKIWFDTDIGSDIDDAVALAYLLSNPECELLGVSTVSGQPVERAQIADAVATAVSRKLAVYPGAAEPLLTAQRQPEAHQASRLPNWPHRAQFDRGSAIEAMYDAIKRNPGEVTLLATGPMTNVALLIKIHPDVPSLLKETVLMGGEFFRKLPTWGEAEWNIYCDPHAAAIVYNEPGLKLRSVGLDVTMQVVMKRDEVAERFTGGALKPVYDFAGPWFERTDRIVFHDPLVAVSIFEPDVMTYDRGTVSVELTSGRAMGRTYFDAAGDGRHEVGVTVDAGRFFEAYFRYFG